MRYGKLCTLILCTVGFGTFSLAQNNTTMGDTTVVGKSQSLQFHLYGGYSLSYQHWVSETRALRYSADIALGFSHSDHDGNSTYSNGNSTGQSDNNQTSNGNSQSMSLSLFLLYPIYETGNLHPFIGFGPTGSFSREFYTGEYESKSTSSSTVYKEESENRNYSLGIGVAGIAGIEYNVTETLSLLAEYRVRVGYSWSKYSYEHKSVNYDSRNSNESSGSSWSFSWESIRLGVGLHF